MGYYIDVEGKIEFHNFEGFKKAFLRKRVENRDYFFTQMWGDDLENLEAYDGSAFEFTREGKYWFDDEKSMEFLSKFASGVVNFHTEDHIEWRWKIDGKGEFVKEERPEWK